MKIQFAFLSLFLATAHAGHEPKGLRGSAAGDEQDQELLDLGYARGGMGGGGFGRPGIGGMGGYGGGGGGGGAGGGGGGGWSGNGGSYVPNWRPWTNGGYGGGGGGGGAGGGGGGGGGWSGNAGGYDWRKWVPNGPYGGKYNPYNGGQESRYGYGNNGGEYGGEYGGGGGGGGCPTKNVDWYNYCSMLEASNCGSCSGRKCTTEDGENGEVCVLNPRYSGGENESASSGSYGGASGNSQGGGGGAACSERGPESCGHTTCTYTDSGCVPNLEFVGVMDEFDEPESEDSGDFLEMDMVIEEE